VGAGDRWLLCMSISPTAAGAFATRHLYRSALAGARQRGYDFVAGLEVEFIFFKLENGKNVAGACRPSRYAARCQPVVARLSIPDRAALRPMEPVLEIVRRDILALGLRCARSRSNSARASANSRRATKGSSPPTT